MTAALMTTKAMATTTILWMALPLFLGFSGYLVPKLGRLFALAVSIISLGYGLGRMLEPSSVLNWQFLDSFGVTLRVDSLSGYFIVTNAVVTAAVVLYCWRQGKNAFFYAQTTLLHGSVNAVFICADFISLYVALEVIGIAAFLLIAYPRTDRSIWVGLRYLFVSNTALLFYLIGAVLVYQANHSFAFMGLQDAPTEAMALIFLGLLTKGGLFVSGLWLPLTHGESETPVSALLSGVVVKAGVFPLVRCGLMMESVATVLSMFAVGATLLGVTYAILERDTKRMLAASTLSQMGFVLVTPAAAGLYALTHGLAKAALFLSVGNLPSRKFQVLRQGKLPLAMWVALAIPSLSMAGLPLLAGFGAKAQTLSYLSGWQQVVMSGAAVGTAIAFSKLLFLPTKLGWPKLKAPGLWWALLPLLSGLLLANSLYGDAYTTKNLLKALATIGGGWLIYGLMSWCIAQNFTKQLQLANVRLPATFERLENLIGMMSLILSLLLGMTLA